MTARELYQAGRLNEAIAALGAELRNDPTDAKRRTFLFELLCFAGDYSRAEKQLEILAQAGREADMGALVYRAALYGERTRHDHFEKKDYPGAASSEPARLSGVINGKPFQTIADADPRIGPRLEIFAAGTYMWIPFEQLTSVEVQQPRRLRDLLWAPALVRTGPAFKGAELGEVMIPVLYPFSSKYASDEVRLGRATEWQENEDGEVAPAGQKLLTVDGEDIPILEVRSLEFASAQAAP